MYYNPCDFHHSFILISWINYKTSIFPNKKDNFLSTYWLGND